MDFDVTDPTKGRSTPFTPHGIANPPKLPSISLLHLCTYIPKYQLNLKSHLHINHGSFRTQHGRESPCSQAKNPKG
jgi:hypothetical protein